jgi:hypothetical protein
MDQPSYLTGFVDGEGCFSVSFSLRSKMNHGIEVRPSFSVSQNRRNLSIIKLLHRYFQCGAVRYSRRDENYKYESRNISDLVQFVIPHFQKYPLRTNKKEDFELFRTICIMIRSSQHLNRSGLQKIITLAYQMNESGKRKYSKQELLRRVAR